MNDMTPDSPRAVLSLFGTSKEGIKLFGDSIINEIKDGNLDPIKVRVWLKTVEEISKYIKDNTGTETETAAGKYPQKFEAFGANLEFTTVSTQYDYSNDEDWQKLDAQKKAREAFLKALKEPITLVDEDTAEVKKVSPPIKNTTEGLKISIK